MEPTQNQRTVTSGPDGKPQKRRRVIRLIRLIGGWTLIGLGILGLFLPFLQGILMLAAGVALLYKESPFMARQIDRFRPHYRLLKMRWTNWRARRKNKS
jgi:uncharacterized protein